MTIRTEPNPMTDAPLDPAAFASIEDDELVFDDVAPPVPPRKTRRAAPKAAAAPELPPSAAPEPAATEEPAEPPAPVPQPGDASAGSALPATAPAATASAGADAPGDAAPRDRGRILLLAIVGLALFTSLMSLGGLIAVSRTLAAAQGQRDAAQRDRDALAALPATLAAIDRASARLAAAAGTGPQSAAPSPIPTTALTVDDLHHALDGLRLSLADRQPAGATAVADALHSGFAEIATRLDRIEAQRARPAPARATATR